MSFRLHDYYVIQPEEAEACAFCGAVKECRPVGPDDERICGRCADKDAETARARWARSCEA